MTKFQFQALPRWFRDFVPLIFWLTLIFVLSSQPALIDFEGETQRHFFYKPAHIVAYALLAWFWWRALTPYRQVTWQVLSLTLVLTILYGISDEIHQLYVPGRSGMVSDVLFDSSGALAMILLLRRLKWIRFFPENVSFRIGINTEQASKMLD